MTKAKTLYLLMSLAAAAAATATAIAAGPPPGRKSIDPDADKMLRGMTDYLASLQSFRVQSAAIDEVVLKSGQKIQLASQSQVSVQRPNHLRSEQTGAANGLAFWYDGKNMTLACKADNSYATLAAPANIDATIDKVRKDFQIDAPGADLLYSRPYDILTEQVTGGKFIGRETIDGMATNHLAFEGEAVDWQIWIQEGAQPLPLRFVVTTKGIKGQPEFTVHLTHWEPRADVGPATFQYAGAAGAKHVDSFPVQCRPGAAH
jgi:hypothetical protein